MSKKHHVDFIAEKVVKGPVKVSFPTKAGQVSFTAREKVLEKVEVKFMAKNK